MGGRLPYKGTRNSTLERAKAYVSSPEHQPELFDHLDYCRYTFLLF